ncbi:MAG: helix-turn-helix domain-containing protein [Candidatus Woesebacteria bacterium]|jgi:cytoskeletal protein RodZ
MKTKSIGEILKEERQAHRFSLENFSKRTRIKVAYLEALEDNQFDLLPAAIFVKAYIKTYGRIFAFDYQPLLALLRRDYKESAKGKLIPREFLKPVLKKRRLSKPVTFALFLFVSIFLVLMSYVVIQWYNLNKPPNLLLISPKEDDFVSSQIVIEGQTDPEALVAVNAEPIAIKPDGSFSTTVHLPREGIATITVEATDRRGKSNLIQRTVYVKF